MYIFQLSGNLLACLDFTPWLQQLRHALLAIHILFCLEPSDSLFVGQLYYLLCVLPPKQSKKTQQNTQQKPSGR